MSASVKIAVAEPSLIIRSGMISVLSRLSTLDVQIVEIADLTAIYDTLCKYNPEILIINPSLLALCPPDRIRAKSGCSKMRCIALRNALTDSGLSDACDGVISLSDSAEQIKDQILRVHTADKGDLTQEQLSAREKEIIVCVVKGFTNKQIAEHLFISPHTVITHRRNIAAKLQIHSPAGLTIYAIVNRLVELNDVKDTIYSNEEPS